MIKNDGRRQRQPLARLFVSAVVAVLALTGCTTTGGSTSEQVLRFAPGLFPVSLDIQTFPAEEPVQTVAQQVLETLVVMEDGQPEPLLAESWSNPDEKTWVFQLRPNVKFSDGTPLTANDVKASVERLISLEGPLKPLFAGVTIQATDDQTVTFTSAQPLGTLASSLSLAFIGQASKIDDDVYWQKPIGTGPFAVDSFTPDDKVVLVRNDSYWGEKAKLDRLEVVNLPDVSARITALQTGEVQVLTTIPPDQVSGVTGSDDITYTTGDGFTYYFIWFNENRKPFDRREVRQAMWYAVNVEGIVKDLYGDGATLAQAPITQSVFGAPQLQPYPYDPERAKALLEEAGLGDGFKTTIHWPREGGPNIRALAQAMVSDWAKVGITVEPLEKERAQWLADFGAFRWDLNLQTNTTGTGDADFTLNRLYTCAAERMGYCNPKLDSLLGQARGSLDQDERVGLYKEASQIIWTDAVGIFPADLKNNAAVRKEVQGFELPVNNRPNFAAVSIAT
jgi:peptide/nickel transport system substrate-binding protein